jgi:hypothetical protein
MRKPLGYGEYYSRQRKDIKRVVYMSQKIEIFTRNLLNGWADMGQCHPMS